MIIFLPVSTFASFLLFLGKVPSNPLNASPNVCDMIKIVNLHSISSHSLQNSHSSKNRPYYLLKRITFIVVVSFRPESHTAVVSVGTQK